MGIEFRTTSGREPTAFLGSLIDAMKVTQSDLQLAGELIKSDIRENTALGVDSDGEQFAPYSTKGPYYYNPGTKGGKFAAPTDKGSKAATTRLLKALPKGSGTRSSTGHTIKFDSYAAFKQAFGRTVVDLQFVTPPHMLDAITVTASKDAVTVGIYGDEAARASGNNYGTGRNSPRRHFFGFSSGVVDKITDLIRDRIMSRAKKTL